MRTILNAPLTSSRLEQAIIETEDNVVEEEADGKWYPDYSVSSQQFPCTMVV